MNNDAEGIVGALAIRPGAAQPIVCTRPMVGAALMRRLIQRRPAASLPDVIASVFTLCAAAQRQTARRALHAALGGTEHGGWAQDRLALSAITARDHLQRFALELPMLVPRAGIPLDPAWVRDAPVFRLPAGADPPTLQRALDGLAGWLEEQLLGMPPERWLAGWQELGDSWFADWAERAHHPVARWLDAVQHEARTIVLPGRALDVLDDAPAGMAALAASLAASLDDQPGFAERPWWRGAPAETGAWTRLGHRAAVNTLWDRLGERLADLLRIACGARLACGALATAPGEAIAWSEMSRGLLVHWVRLEAGATDAATAQAERYRLLAPTEWNFHPDGALGRALARGDIDTRGAQLAVAVLDPCVPFSIDSEAGRA
jgi:hypothetical protein